MRTKSDSDYIGLVAALYFLLVALLIESTSCAHARPVLTYPRSPADAVLAAVAVKTECGWGSGVLIDGTHVLTAHHVVDCNNDPKKVVLAKSIRVEMADGKIFVAAYDALDASRDLARLRLPSTVENVRPLTVAHAPAFGEIVCAVTAIPERGFRCGVIADMPTKNRVDGDIMFTAQIWLGNSGSALYNVEGALVGIVISTYWCDDIDKLLWQHAHVRPARTCGARATSIDGPVAP